MERETVSGPDTEDQAAMPEWRVYAPEFPQWYVWRGVIQLGKALGQPDHGDPAVTAAGTDPPQAGQRRAGQNLINGRHGSPTLC